MALSDGPVTHKQRRRSWRRGLGLSGVLLLLAVGGGLTASMGRAYVVEDVKPFAIVARERYQHTPGPITLAVRGLPPKGGVDGADGTPSPDIRAIRVFAGRIELVAGGVRRRVVAFDKPAINLHDVVTLVADPAWISEAPGGDFTLDTALVADSRSHLVLAAPAVTHVLLADRPGVLIGTQDSGSLSFDGVTVESDLRRIPANDAQGTYRPAVVASGATMDITNSRFQYLGWDWNGSYGVSWVNGASGKAVDSTFRYSFIGAYTSMSRSIQFVGGEFSDNTLYGIDPHTGSSDLLVSRVLAEHNGAHGIIFSNNVTNSTVTGCTSRFNGENGIMMDESSTDNRIVGNTVYGNTGDGLVATDSARNAWIGNTVRDNRVGIRVEPADATTVFSDNVLVANKLAAENVTLDSSNHSRDNGGEWRAAELARIWIWTGCVYAVLVILTFVAVGIHRLRPARLRVAT